MAGDLQRAAWLGVKQQMRWATAFAVSLTRTLHTDTISLWKCWFCSPVYLMLTENKVAAGFCGLCFFLFYLVWSYLGFLVSFALWVPRQEVWNASLFVSFSLGRLWNDSCNFWSPRKLGHQFPQCPEKIESVSLGSSYLSSSWNIVCHVSIFGRPLCKLLFLCDSEIWAFPFLRMTSFSWKKLISGLFIPSCQKSWVFLLMERSCINSTSFLIRVCVCVFIHLYTWWGNKNVSFFPY